MSLSSNAVVAKARAVFGRMLKPEDYNQLASKETVGDVFAYLKQTPRFEKTLASVNPQIIHRGQLENLMLKSVYEIFDSFRRFDFTESTGFFKYIVMRLEIEQIILAVQSVWCGSTDEYIASLPLFISKSASVDLAALGTSASLVEAAEILRPTPYFKAVGDLLMSSAESGSFDVGEFERRIYTQYYMRLLKAVDKEYKGTERKELRRLILRGVDMANVVTLYRYNAVFGAELSQIPLFEFKYRLSDSVIEQLVRLDSAEKIAAQLTEIGYRFEGEAPRTVELLTERISLDFLKKSLRLSQSSAAAYFALSECLSIELRNIKTLIEGTRYGMEGSRILELLVI